MNLRGAGGRNPSTRPYHHIAVAPNQGVRYKGGVGELLKLISSTRLSSLSAMFVDVWLQDCKSLARAEFAHVRL